MKPLVTMREALADPDLLGTAIPGDSWTLWRTLLIAAMGERLTDEERVAFTAVTGRDVEPLEPVDELWAIVGRRGGKTRAAGTLAAYVGGLCDHAPYLAPGERGVIPILAASVTQAGRVFMHAKGILQHSPQLAGQIMGDPTSDTIRLQDVDIEVKAANFRTVRSITAVAAIADELAFWMVEGTTNPDAEILNALRPALATTRGPLMVISSPHAKKGELYGAFRRDYGPEGDPLILVAKGPSKTFNSTLPQKVIDRAYAKDAAVASAEYGAEFRDDLEAFVSREIVEACVAVGVTERAPVAGIAYKAFVDPSGGRGDSFCLAIGHRSGDRAVIDAVRERKPPFNPDTLIAEYADLLKSYGISSVTGDRYGGEFAPTAFRRNGIEYRPSEHFKSALYQSLLPLLNSTQVELLDVPGVVSQISGLERRVAWGGKESIDHPPHGHDDVANVIAGVASMLVLKRQPPVALFSTYASAVPTRRRAWWDAPREGDAE